MSAQDDAWNAMNTLPKPVDEQSALAAAKGVLTNNEYAQFAQWFDANSMQLLAMLNGINS